ncbi:MAG: SpoIID/LytB domain-containing protein [Oscillospiraceae bacterium]|nr:SpoIID/LytB domain-containing protein [Oscillospiraceae bacterium]
MALCFGAAPPRYAAANVPAGMDPLIRVGLFYGGTAVPGANLQNQTGTGYRIGFFDSQGMFIQLFSTTHSRISMVKNRNVYWDGAQYQDSASGAMVGAYHIDTGAFYADVYSAQLDADTRAAAGQNAFVSYSDGVFRVYIDSYATLAEAQNAAGQAGGTGGATGSVYCVSVAESGTSRILFQFDAGHANTPLVVQPSLGEVERPVTHFRGGTYAGMFEYRRMDGNNISVVNCLSMKDYIKGINEMPASWHIEALKAQALCAKSYAYAGIGRHASSGFDMCAGQHCQVYRGTLTERESTNTAADAVEGLYILYEGKPIQAVYHSSNGGYTEDVKNIWSQDLPYLSAVHDPHEDLSAAMNGRWQYTLTNDTLTGILNSKGYNLGNVVGFAAEYTAAGNVALLRFTFASGQTREFTKESARTILNTSDKTYTFSQRFTVTSGNLTLSVMGPGGLTTTADAGNIPILGPDGKLSYVTASSYVIGAAGATAGIQQTQGSGAYVISGTGWGHNVGMSQNGAKGMAEKGFDCFEIIKYYFSGVEIGYIY